MASLHVVTGPNHGTRISLDRECYVIRRDPGSDIVVPSFIVSRRHCRIIRRGQQFLLEDLESRCGTILNQSHIKEAVVLKNGDRIRAGAFEAVFELLEPSSATNG